jgi:Ca2+/Na+ antiporter
MISDFVLTFTLCYGALIGLICAVYVFLIFKQKRREVENGNIQN